jgi:hypothetical protein
MLSSDVPDAFRRAAERRPPFGQATGTFRAAGDDPMLLCEGDGRCTAVGQHRYAAALQALVERAPGGADQQSRGAVPADAAREST